MKQTHQASREKEARMNDRCDLKCVANEARVGGVRACRCLTQIVFIAFCRGR